MIDAPHDSNRHRAADPFDRAVDRVTSDTERRRQERSRRRQRTGFRIHATAFVAMQLLILAVWLVVWQTGGTSYPWFAFPLAGWAVGLAVHYSAVHDAYRSRPRD